MDTLSEKNQAHKPDALRDRGAFLPDESPLAMPTQSLKTAPLPTEPSTFANIAARRAFILFGTAALTLAGGYEMYEVLRVGGITALEAAVFALFVVLFAWVAFSFMSAIAGFMRLMVRSRDALNIDDKTPLPSIGSSNAMLLPTYNEDPHRIMARLRAMCESVDRTGQASRLDWFILSDSTSPSIWIEEEKAFLDLRHDFEAIRVFYRHRPQNTARKSGNIEDWVKRFGAKYDHMIVLDADSLMTGDTIVRLVAAMEHHPDVGLIQTLPIIVNATTLFARLQQFAGRLYGPLIASGIAWWHGSEGNYWGHNAIIRVRAFAGSAGLPDLRGRKPFGGHILSHDFVEAALMRRAGWGIFMTPTLGGSFEECPPSLIDFAARDRRWCQGNLQHVAILPARGLHWISRLHFLAGIGSYITAPLWLIFLFLGILISLQAQFFRPEYFPKEFSLFPQWPAQDPIRAAWVFVGTMGLLLVPKLLAFILLLTQRENRRRFGGSIFVFVSIVFETILSGLTAPVMMIFQSSAVSEILLGRDAGWQVQRRDDGVVAPNEIVRKYAMPTLIGVGMAASAYSISLPLLVWMTPVILGLLLAIPIAFLSSGRRTKGVSRSRLFSTPEQNTPPQVLIRANQLTVAPSRISADPLRELRNDRHLLEEHVKNLPAVTRDRGKIDPHLAIARAKIEDARCFDEALEYLNPRETYSVMNSPTILRAAMDLSD